MANFCRNCRHTVRFITTAADRPKPGGRTAAYVCPACDLAGREDLIGAWLDMCQAQFAECIRLARVDDPAKSARHLEHADRWLDLASAFVSAGR